MASMDTALYPHHTASQPPNTEPKMHADEKTALKKPIPSPLPTGDSLAANAVLLTLRKGQQITIAEKIKRIIGI